jgi:hypothetical protein
LVGGEGLEEEKWGGVIANKGGNVCVLEWVEMFHEFSLFLLLWFLQSWLWQLLAVMAVRVCHLACRWDHNEVGGCLPVTLAALFRSSQFLLAHLKRYFWLAGILSSETKMIGGGYSKFS